LGVAIEDLTLAAAVGREGDRAAGDQLRDGDPEVFVGPAVKAVLVGNDQIDQFLARKRALDRDERLLGGYALNVFGVLAVGRRPGDVEVDIVAALAKVGDDLDVPEDSLARADPADGDEARFPVVPGLAGKR
jgi:hypothetical protein